MPRVMANKGPSWNLHSGLMLKPKFLLLLESMESTGMGGEVADVILP